MLLRAVTFVSETYFDGGVVNTCLPVHRHCSLQLPLAVLDIMYVCRPVGRVF